MDLGNKLLERTYPLAAPSQHDVRQRILTNEWLYHIARREFGQAQEIVSTLNNSSPEIKVYGWQAIRGWTCVAAFASRDHSGTMQTAEQQWKQLSSRYFRAN
jgi:hypothetical protein